MTGARSPLGGPEAELLLAYRGTAYLLRRLGLLSERAFDEPGDSNAPDDRRGTLATVGYDARGWAELARGCREGDIDPRTFPPGDREELVHTGRSLPPRALRHLVEHSAVHLAVEWRDLPAAGWRQVGRDHQGLPMAASDAPWLRARQVWLAAVDLGNGGSFADLPTAVAQRILIEEGGRLDPGDPSQAHATRAGVRVSGPIRDVARWLSRGGERNLRVSEDPS